MTLTKCGPAEPATDQGDGPITDPQAPRAFRPILLTSIFVLGAAALWMTRDAAVQGGDRLHIESERIYRSPKPIYYYREPGAVLLWQACAWSFQALDPAASRTNLEDRSLRLGFALLGSVSGGLYLAFLACFLGEFPGASPRRLAAAAVVILAGAISLTFGGHIEFYAPLYASLMFFYWRAARYFRAPSGANFVWIVVAAFIAVNVHRVAAFHLVGMAALFTAGRPVWRPRRPNRTETLAMLVALIAASLAHIIPSAIAAFDPRPILVLAYENWLPELITPPTQAWADYVYEHSPFQSVLDYTFGSAEHLKHFLFFMAAGAPVAIPILLFALRRPLGEIQKFLLLSAVAGWIWALVWYPTQSYGDWDLFCNPALPTNVLAAVLILGMGNGNETRMLAP